MSRMRSSSRVTNWFGVSLVGLILAGCAHQRPAEPAQAAPSVSRQLLETLLQTRRTADAEIAQLQQEMTEFRQHNPALDAMRRVIPEQLSQISQAYIAAQLAVIDARSQFAPDHPALVAARQREKELDDRYQQAIRSSIELGKLETECDRLATELATKQQFVRRLDERIRELEVVIDAESIDRV